MNLQIITNEVKVAEKILDGSYGKPINKHTKIFTLAKYYLHHKQETVDDTIYHIHNYLRESSDKYIWEMNDDYVSSVVKKAYQSPLIKIDSVEIYESEIEQIRKVKNLIKEKVLFSYLVHAKINYQIKELTNGWVRDSSKDIFYSVGINYTSKRRELIIKDLITDGYLTTTKSIDNTTKQVCFMALTGKLSIEIDNFEQLGLQYESLTGICEVIECENCGKLIRRKNNKIRYCKDCAEYIESINKRERSKISYYSKISAK